ncbi:MAG: Fic family protein [Opitutales bacterium]|nr:Fic family protein [Opitutales bacterium]
MKRILANAINKNLISAKGNGRACKYSITPKAHLLRTYDVEEYFKKEIDERVVQTSFNFDLLENLLPTTELFSEKELSYLNNLQEKFLSNVANISADVYNSEMERLGIDLSWKSSQIEGNTYSLLETERLLREKKEAKGKTKEEAIMLLNHKEALHFLIDNPDYLQSLSVRRIEDIHSILVKDLNVERNIRRSRVGITGTNYKPLDNEFQIAEAMELSCNLINNRQNVFEKALLAILLLSYIQPFADGNKRTSRIVSNALLIANKYCPLSFRSVDSLKYKEAVLIFYEQNNLSAFKKIFIEQYDFAVSTYF